MTSAYLQESLWQAWNIAEARSRRYQPGSMSPLPVLPERQEDMDRIEEAQGFARDHTDRQVAAAYPEIVQKAVRRSFWVKVRPEPEPVKPERYVVVKVPGSDLFCVMERDFSMEPYTSLKGTGYGQMIIEGAQSLADHLNARPEGEQS